MMVSDRVVELSSALSAELRRQPKQEPLPLGMHFDVPPQRYYRRALGIVSKSGLDRFHRSPAHYRAWVDGQLDRDTSALLFGRAFHCAVLEPERFAEEYVAEPDFGNCTYKANKERRNAWRDEHAGHTWLDSDDATAIAGMCTSLRKHPLAANMVRNGRSEVTVVWDDPDTGLRCQSRADYYVERLAMLVDVKSTDDASPDGFKRSITKYRYHVQDALYRFGFSAVGATVQHFVLLAVEKQPPYAVGTYALDADAIGRGYSAARRDIDGLADCIKRDHWPAYPETIQQLELPPWAD